MQEYENRYPVVSAIKTSGQKQAQWKEHHPAGDLAS
jgi:hypothetical protein